MKSPLGRYKKSPQLLAAEKRTRLRQKNLSHPITAEDITAFTKCLVAVPFDNADECWLYVGCRKATTDGLRFKLGAYANRKFHKETVGPHQFAYAAACGLTLADLSGFDIHHSAKFGRCVGYRCCNPSHLDAKEHRNHAREHGDERKIKADNVAARHVQQIESLLVVAPVQRGPEDLRVVTGAGRKHRCFAGMPFLIQLGQMDGIEESDSEGSAA
jgi:hypothetical protein